MANEIVAASGTPEDDQEQPRRGETRHDKTEGARRRQRRRQIYTCDDCLVMLTQLPGMLKAKYITPAEANSIRPVLQAILAEHRTGKRAHGPQKPMPENLLRLVRANPELQIWFEPSLSDEDVQALMEEPTNEE